MDNFLSPKLFFVDATNHASPCSIKLSNLAVTYPPTPICMSYEMNFNILIFLSHCFFRLFFPADLAPISIVIGIVYPLNLTSQACRYR